MPQRVFRTRALGMLRISASLLGTACSAAGPSTPGATTAPASAPEKAGAVTAGMQIGTSPLAPAGWTPPTKITPVSPLPGTFQSVGDTPAQPGAKVRVFFLGMQW